ncbi:universal stress protein [Haloparvum sedimenti]|uniref:universal stress protein n=1 Tax=Haloparvum sedimenti TaxID=1678448 RepID=UPI00071E7A08|nr:universal stress protein [Haloparvum sedimenti]
MFETIVIATDGSESVSRAVGVALDIADRFDATVHALYVVDSGEVESSPDAVREDLRDALDAQGREALDEVRERAAETVAIDVEGTVREGRPAAEIAAYAREVDADCVATGTRGRHGENRFLIGSVAERVVRTCPVPVLTVRQLTGEDPRRTTI